MSMTRVVPDQLDCIAEGGEHICAVLRVTILQLDHHTPGIRHHILRRQMVQRIGDHIRFTDVAAAAVRLQDPIYMLQHDILHQIMVIQAHFHIPLLLRSDHILHDPYPL